MFMGECYLPKLFQVFAIHPYFIWANAIRPYLIIVFLKPQSPFSSDCDTPLLYLGECYSPQLSYCFLKPQSPFSSDCDTTLLYLGECYSPLLDYCFFKTSISFFKSITYRVNSSIFSIMRRCISPTSSPSFSMVCAAGILGRW